MKKWTVSNIDNAEYIGIIEFQSNNGECLIFEIYLTEDKTRLVFGNHCNCGLLESGYILFDDCFSLDENLQELIADLETYYNDGEQYVIGIVCNDRM